MTDLPAALALERPCRPCQDDQHDRCLAGARAGIIWICCCDDLDRDPAPPR